MSSIIYSGVNDTYGSKLKMKRSSSTLIVEWIKSFSLLAVAEEIWLVDGIFYQKLLLYAMWEDEEARKVN